jgi:hypothetical protein
MCSRHVPRYNEEIVRNQELSTYRQRLDRDTQLRNQSCCVMLPGGVRCHSYATDMIQVWNFEQKYTNAYEIVCVT